MIVPRRTDPILLVQRPPGQHFGSSWRGARSILRASLNGRGHKSAVPVYMVGRWVVSIPDLRCDIRFVREKKKTVKEKRGPGQLPRLPCPTKFAPVHRLRPSGTPPVP